MKSFYPLVIISIVIISATSCLRKQTTCKCSYPNEKKKISYDMKRVGNMQDSCRVLDQQAEMNEGNCYLR